MTKLIRQSKQTQKTTKSKQPNSRPHTLATNFVAAHEEPREQRATHERRRDAIAQRVTVPVRV